MQAGSLIDVSDEDAEVFKALALPSMIDVHGRLFVLREDGATVLVNGPAGSGQVRFFKPCTSGLHKWVATNKKIYILINGEREFLIAFDKDTFFYSDIAPQYTPIFPINENSSCIGLSTLKGFASIEIDGDRVSWPAVHPNFHGLGGWVHEDVRYFVGMVGRPLTKAGDHARGNNSFIRCKNQPERKAHIDSMGIDGNAIAACLGDTYPIGSKTSLKVECWLHTDLLRNNQPLLVGGIVDVGLFEDECLLGPVPDYTDYNVIGVFKLINSVPVLQSAFYPYRFWQAISIADGSLLYLQDCEQQAGVSVRTFYVVRIDRDGGISNPEPLRIDGLSSDLRVSFMDLHYDERIGFYGSFVLAKTFASHECCLIRSEDGINWAFVHDLAPIH